MTQPGSVAVRGSFSVPAEGRRVPWPAGTGWTAPRSRSGGELSRRTGSASGLSVRARSSGMMVSRERFSDALHAPRLSPPPPPLARGGKSAASGLFSPLAKGGHRGVLRVPLRCARFGIQAITARYRSIGQRPAEASRPEIVLPVGLRREGPWFLVKYHERPSVHSSNPWACWYSGYCFPCLPANVGNSKRSPVHPAK